MRARWRTEGHGGILALRLYQMASEIFVANLSTFRNILKCHESVA